MSTMSESDVFSRLEHSPDNPETEVRTKIREYFSSTLFSNIPPIQIDFEKLGGYPSNVLIEETLSLDDEDAIFAKYGINGFLLKATINKQPYILFTESLKSKNFVWHANEKELKHLYYTDDEYPLQADTLNLSNLRGLIKDKFRNIEKSSKLKTLINQ
ncbi:MAG: hypothetical protein PHQ18_01800 [Patescibacteria group bacterium]|nr:hypothetical protein [Patescibacteria group bacterium]